MLTTYHIVLVPKYRRKVIYKKLRKDIGKILRTLCDYKHVEIIEAHAMPASVNTAETGCSGLRRIPQGGKYADGIRKTRKHEVQIWTASVLE